MQFITDFHIHPHHSKASSNTMDIVNLSKWGQIKGLNIIGTGDFTHPKRFAEIKEKLIEKEAGLLELKTEYQHEIALKIPPNCQQIMRFLLTTSVCNVYKRHGKTRKMTNLILCPNLITAARINESLSEFGELNKNGQPLLNLDSEEMLKIILDISEDCLIIPSLSWSKTSSLLGTKFGFNSLDEAFGDITSHIYALETDRASSSVMNYAISRFQNLCLIANSSSYSPNQLGQQTNVFDCDFNYQAIIKAIKENSLKKFTQTIESYPEADKYYFDGHRNCDTCLSPEESRKLKLLCPVCGKAIHLGTKHRIDQLSELSDINRQVKTRPTQLIIPLIDILAELMDLGPKTKTVENIYQKLIAKLGPELTILVKLPIPEIESLGGYLLADAIKRMRAGEIHIKAGFDGERGQLRVFDPKERESLGGKQVSIF